MSNMKKVQVVRTRREVYEFEVPEETNIRGYHLDKMMEDLKEQGVIVEPKLIDSKDLDYIRPIGDDVLESQTLKENYLILAEFQRIWNEYPRESFSSTLQELARTIHEEDPDLYNDYLPEDYWQKYYTNEGTEEDPDYVEIEDLWSERWDAEYKAIHLMMKDFNNDEWISWLRRLVEFIGY